jgi:hypothetical protein
MELTKSTPPARRLDPCDAALLAAFAMMAILGTWQRSLLVHDTAVYLAAAWLGNAWDLAYGQFPSRAVSSLLTFGPAWALRVAFAPSFEAFVILAHGLCFMALLVPWLIVRAVEPQRIFSRLYLAMVLPLAYFPSEIIIGTGLWMIWIAVLANPVLPRMAKRCATAVIAPALIFTHPGVALLSVVFAAVGGVLILFGRPFPRPLALAAATMGVFLIAAYFVTAALLPVSPLLAGQHAGGKYNYVDPLWILGTLSFFPALAVLWLLLLAPGLEGAALRWRLPMPALLVLGAIGLWFAFNGTNILMWIFARQSAPYALAVALCLALASPASHWLTLARGPLMIFAAVVMTAAVSYAIDLSLFGRAADARLAPVIAEAAPPPNVVAIDQPAESMQRVPAMVYFKWTAAPDYVRDIVFPDYGGGRMTFAFYTFFRSNRRAVLYRSLDRPGEWVPFECAAVDRALNDPHDAIDARMLRFIRGRYCAR